jgi:hypothetical protein
LPWGLSASFNSAVEEECNSQRKSFACVRHRSQLKLILKYLVCVETSLVSIQKRKSWFLYDRNAEKVRKSDNSQTISKVHTNEKICRYFLFFNFLEILKIIDDPKIIR